MEGISMRRLTLLLAALGLVGVAVPAAAQDRTGSWEISPFAGGYFGSRLYDNAPFYAGSPAAGALLYTGRIDVSDDLVYGVRLGYNVNRWLGIEADWTHARPDLTTRVPVALPAGSSSFPLSTRTKVGRLTQDAYEANALFNFGRRKVIGYFGLGAGASVMKTDLTGVGSNESTRFTGNVSLGGKFFFTPNIGIRLDGRYRYTDLGHDTRNGTACDRFGYCYDDRNRWYSSGEVTGGLTFAF
jgi:opacity protein-like surface antigen